MAQPIELILVRHLGDSLAVPLFLVDAEGRMVFYNEGAEQLLGRRYDDAGEMDFAEWTSIFAVRDHDGRSLDAEELPLVRALRTQRPAHAAFAITGLDGAPHRLEVSAFPLTGHGGRLLGAAALFWETTDD
ncbi:MAG TPA: PAS domain-containing protein [Candidatus Limnocylindria bacterium]